MKIPSLSGHDGEIGLLAWLGTGVIAVLLVSAWKGWLGGTDAIDVAAFLLVLQRIVEAVQKRWEQRSFDRMGDGLQKSAPTAEGPSGEATDPIYTREK